MAVSIQLDQLLRRHLLTQTYMVNEVLAVLSLFNPVSVLREVNIVPEAQTLQSPRKPLKTAPN